MRVLAVALIMGTLAGCLDSQPDGPDPHELVPCDASWLSDKSRPFGNSGGWECELACETLPTAAEAVPCGNVPAEINSRTFDGQRGVCGYDYQGGNGYFVRWRPCQ